MVCRRHAARTTSWRAVVTLAAGQRPWVHLRRLNRRRLERENSALDLPAPPPVASEPVESEKPPPVQQEDASAGVLGDMIEGLGLLNPITAPASRSDWVNILVPGSDQRYKGATAQFGADPVDLSGKLVLMKPLSGKNLQNGVEMHNAIAVCTRGQISFADKAKVAEQAGAKALLVIQEGGEWPFLMPGDGSELAIVCAMLKEKAGRQLLEEIAQSESGLQASIVPHCESDGLFDGIADIGAKLGSGIGGISSGIGDGVGGFSDGLDELSTGIGSMFGSLLSSQPPEESQDKNIPEPVNREIQPMPTNTEKLQADTDKATALENLGNNLGGLGFVLMAAGTDSDEDQIIR